MLFGMFDRKHGKNERISYVFGGKGGIRTPDTVNRMPDFESGAFDHSATFPGLFETIGRH